MDNKVTCWVVGSGGVWLKLPPAEFVRRERAGEVYGVGAEAHQARLEDQCSVS